MLLQNWRAKITSSERAPESLPSFDARFVGPHAVKLVCDVAAAPKVCFEPNLTDSAQCTNVCLRRLGRIETWGPTNTPWRWKPNSGNNKAAQRRVSMKQALVSLVCCASIFAGASWAGTPVDEATTCPVGGEEFEITGTLSCSTQGRTMSFRPLTSCDFVTRLPICPGNGLPIYQEFSNDQVARLEEFVETPEYNALRELPPWQRAHGVSVFLDQSGTEVAFGILLNALWYETEELLASDSAFNQFVEETEAELQRASEADRPFLEAILAYALSAAGRFDEANLRLDRAKQTPEVPEFLLHYITAIQECQSDMSRDGCRPSDRFNP